LHFGNPLWASTLPRKITKTFTRFTSAYLLFRKPSLGMQQWTKTNAVQHLAASTLSSVVRFSGSRQLDPGSFFHR
jgi:hypothetical protein